MPIKIKSLPFHPNIDEVDLKGTASGSDDPRAATTTTVNVPSGFKTDIAGLTNVAAGESAPANTPMLLKGEGTKTVTVLTDTPAAPATNMLSVGDGMANGSKVPYVLAKNGKRAGFKQWTGDLSVLNGRVVLWLDSEISAARSFFAFFLFQFRYIA